MVSGPVLIAVLLILLLLILALSVPLVYSITTQKNANAACKIFASQFKIGLFLPWIQFAPLVPLCDVVAPF